MRARSVLLCAGLYACSKCGLLAGHVACYGSTIASASPLICYRGSMPAGVEQVLSASSEDSVSLQSEEISLCSSSVIESLSDRMVHPLNVKGHSSESVSGVIRI